jgi:hypothetical protein
MLALVMLIAATLFALAATVVVYDLRAGISNHQNRLSTMGDVRGEPQVLRRTSVALVLLAWMPLLIAMAVAVVHCSAGGLND